MKKVPAKLSLLRSQLGSSATGVLVGVGALSAATMMAIQQQNKTSKSVNAAMVAEASSVGDDLVMNGLSVMKAVLDPKVATADLGLTNATGLPLIYSSNYFSGKWDANIAPNSQLPSHITHIKGTNQFSLSIPTTHRMPIQDVENFFVDSSRTKDGSVNAWSRLRKQSVGVELVQAEKGRFSESDDGYHLDLVRAKVTASIKAFGKNGTADEVSSRVVKTALLPVALPRPGVPRLYVVKNGVETLHDPSSTSIDGDVTELRIKADGLVKSVDLDQATIGAPFCDGQKFSGLGLNKQGDVAHGATNAFAKDQTLVSIPLCPKGVGVTGTKKYEFKTDANGGCGKVTGSTIAGDPSGGGGAVSAATFKIRVNSPDSTQIAGLSKTYNFTMAPKGGSVGSFSGGGSSKNLSNKDYATTCNQYCEWGPTAAKWFLWQQENLSNKLWDLDKKLEQGDGKQKLSGIPPGFKQPQLLHQSANIAFKDYASPWFKWEAKKMGIKDKKVCVNLQHAIEKGLMWWRNSGGKPNMTYQQIPNNPKSWFLPGVHSYLTFFYYDPGTCTRHKMFKRGKCGCFAEDTMITMADGSKRAIQTLEAGDKVWNPKTQKAAVIDRMVVGPEKLPLLSVTVGGNTVDVTGKHPFLTPFGDVKAYLLQPGDLVWSGQEEGYVPVAEIKAKHHEGEAPDVFNLMLKGSDAFEDHYVEANGIPTGDLFIQNSISDKPQTSRSLVSRNQTL